MPTSEALLHLRMPPMTNSATESDAAAQDAGGDISSGPANPAPTAAPRSQRNGPLNRGPHPVPRDGAAQPGVRDKTRPQGRKVHPVLVRLFELYPKMFGARFLPLKLGVFQDLLALHSEEFKREDLKSRARPAYPFHALPGGRGRR